MISFFKGEKLEEQYRIDMLVANKLILEFKTVPDLNDSHIRQLLTYLESSVYEVGMLLTFLAVVCNLSVLYFKMTLRNISPTRLTAVK